MTENQRIFLDVYCKDVGCDADVLISMLLNENIDAVISESSEFLVEVVRRGFDLESFKAEREDFWRKAGRSKWIM